MRLVLVHLHVRHVTPGRCLYRKITFMGDCYPSKSGGWLQWWCCVLVCSAPSAHLVVNGKVLLSGVACWALPTGEKPLVNTLKRISRCVLPSDNTLIESTTLRMCKRQQSLRRTQLHLRQARLRSILPALGNHWFRLTAFPLSSLCLTSWMAMDFW